jgi:hypothetical protein
VRDTSSANGLTNAALGGRRIPVQQPGAKVIIRMTIDARLLPGALAEKVRLTCSREVLNQIGNGYYQFIGFDGFG